MNLFMKKNDFNFLCRKALVGTLMLSDGYRQCLKYFENDFEALESHLNLLKEDFIKIKEIHNKQTGCAKDCRHHLDGSIVECGSFDVTNLLQTKKEEVALKKLKEIGLHLKSLGAFLIFMSNERKDDKQKEFFDEVNKIEDLLDILEIKKIENSYITTEQGSILVSPFNTDFYVKMMTSKNLFESECKKNVFDFFEKTRSDENLINNNVFFMAQVLYKSKGFSSQTRAQLYSFYKDDLPLISFFNGNGGIEAQVELLKDVKCFFKKQNNNDNAEYIKEIDYIAKQLFITSMSGFSANLLKLNWSDFFNEKEIISFEQMQIDRLSEDGKSVNLSYDRSSFNSLTFEKIVRNYWISGFSVERNVSLFLGLKEQYALYNENSFYNKKFRENFFGLLKEKYPQVFNKVSDVTRRYLIESCAPKYLLNSYEKTEATEALEYLEQISLNKVNDKSVEWLKGYLSNGIFCSKKESELKSFVVPSLKKVLHSERKILQNEESVPLILKMAKNYTQCSTFFKEVIKNEIEEIINSNEDLSIRKWFSKSSGCEVSLLMSLMILAGERTNSIEDKDFFRNNFVALMKLGASATKELPGATKNVLEKSKSAQYLKPMSALIEKFILDESVSSARESSVRPKRAL